MIFCPTDFPQLPYETLFLREKRDKEVSLSYTVMHDFTSVELTHRCIFPYCYSVKLSSGEGNNCTTNSSCVYKYYTNVSRILKRY